VTDPETLKHVLGFVIGACSGMVVGSGWVLHQWWSSFNPSSGPKLFHRLGRYAEAGRPPGLTGAEKLIWQLSAALGCSLAITVATVAWVLVNRDV